jgi:hypothetical protein
MGILGFLRLGSSMKAIACDRVMTTTNSRRNILFFLNGMVVGPPDIRDQQAGEACI